MKLRNAFDNQCFVRLRQAQNDILLSLNTIPVASYFKQHGYKNVLHLDGFVSRTYPSSKKQTQLDGSFNVIIGVSEIKEVIIFITRNNERRIKSAMRSMTHEDSKVNGT